ncbi:YwmB family TATA-box binding protein [Aquibacillus rhizosphaerae]|uniref:YwmB family TATA-box binding protein n=1 Tax=Aquibacillus rhizosphaerae TaxID=3051431 RepID=A0ABT7KZC0_9BACI|nr:YwmB family TATA-box binding protein [Aquibacillus sp. LR5S19]MDL4838857.1 YwmB family TATA-box binding protein [Aquibacillus sp. LR5S19]
MKTRFILGSIIFTIIIFSFQTLSSASTNQLTEINQIANLLEQEDIFIDNWEVIVKEKKDYQTFEQMLKKVKKEYEGYKFEKTETKNATKFIFKPHKNDIVDESFILIVPKSNAQEYEITYKITGNNWNEEIQETYENKLEEITRELFTENLTKFSCIKTQSSVIMDRVSMLNHLQEKLNVQALNNIHEEDFTVLSGFTPRWETVIPTSDKSLPMNVQLAAREGLGGKTTITIGTPIITTEY